MMTRKAVVCSGCHKPLVIKSEGESVPATPVYCRQCRLVRETRQALNTTVDENQILAWLMAGSRKRG